MYIRIPRLLAIVSAALLGPTGVYAAGNSTTVTGSATAEIMDPISVSHVGGQSLKFGTFSVGLAGTVVVSPTGSGTATGGVTRTGGPGTSADRFTVSGKRNRAISIVTYPGTVSSGPNTMSFTTTPSVMSGTLSNGGQLTFSVGGTLAVAGGQTGGTYVGSYTAGVIYN